MKSATLVLFILLSCILVLFSNIFLIGRSTNRVAIPATTSNAKAVLLYTFFTRVGDDSSCRSNFAFFLEKGVEQSSVIDFVFIIVGNSLVPAQALSLSKFSNVKFVHIKNYGSDLCNVYHVIQDLHVADHYQNFFVMNCGARGPYGGSSKLFYVDQFLNRLNSSVRLVGASISCEKNIFSNSVHVQSWFMALDKVSLGVALSLWKNCPWKKWGDAILEGEVGTSAILIKAGFKIGSMQKEFSPFYQGKTCSSLKNPGLAQQNLDEQIFIKFGGEIFRSGLGDARTRIQVVQREGWIGNDVEGSIDLWVKENTMKEVHRTCKEARFLYLQQYQDIKRAQIDPWTHYKMSGKNEGRVWRGVSCETGLPIEI